MRNNAETRDAILIMMISKHPVPQWDKENLRFPGSGCFCEEEDCDCPLAPLSAIHALVRQGLVRLNKEKGYVLTEKGVRAATLVWNRHCVKEGKKALLKEEPA